MLIDSIFTNLVVVGILVGVYLIGFIWLGPEDGRAETKGFVKKNPQLILLKKILHS
ncbi:hypothetical protein HOB87_12275 [Candidatus Woesearchaeota archaeon]|jgi:hypothetical protein|nr:hypothetical protein [Candidatus Woesearchaeota archaeon]